MGQGGLGDQSYNDPGVAGFHRGLRLNALSGRVVETASVVTGANITSVMFEGHEGSYLAGVLAAQVMRDGHHVATLERADMSHLLL